MKSSLPFLGFLALFLSSCATAPQQTGPVMIPGRMFNLKDGTEFEFAAERSSGTGSMTARNLTTGEKFSGTYTAMLVDGGVSQGAQKDAWGFNVGTVTTVTQATKGVGKGVLRGDKGTIISLSLDIKPSFDPRVHPSGFGEGIDAKNVRYQVQFGGS